MLPRWTVFPYASSCGSKNPARHHHACGMGCSVEFDRNKNPWVRFVYQGSPADDAGIIRSEYKSANANDETDYFDGIEPTCPAVDDLARKFGDREEDALKTALYYIANDSCPAPTAAVRAMLTEEPLHINELKGLRREIGAF